MILVGQVQGKPKIENKLSHILYPYKTFKRKAIYYGHAIMGNYRIFRDRYQECRIEKVKISLSES